MLRKFSTLLGVITSVTLLLISTLFYPGGSKYDPNSTGFDWKENYLSNLFGEKAVNGLDNPSRLWAIGGMFFLCASFAVVFIRFSRKITASSAAKIIKYLGISSMVFAFLVVTPLHDIMITISVTCVLVCMFYITVFLFKSKLFPMKILSVVCLLVSYTSIYMYYTRSYLEFLPIMQKIELLIAITWTLCLEYFTTIADFQLVRTSRS